MSLCYTKSDVPYLEIETNDNVYKLIFNDLSTITCLAETSINTNSRIWVSLRTCQLTPASSDNARDKRDSPLIHSIHT